VEHAELQKISPKLAIRSLAFLQKDTAGFEFGQNQKNQYFGPLVNTEKFHEIPHSYHNKENLVNHVENNYHYSFDCSSVPAHRQTRTVVDNHNHNVNYSHITEVVEGD
nr:hypothetical protein [Tanacetum cinerariifolium]